MLFDTTIQAIFTDIDADEDGTVIQQAAAKYDYILGKYGTTTYTNFLGRSVVNQSNALGKKIVADNTLTIILVIVSLSAFSVMMHFVCCKKRRKHE